MKVYERETRYVVRRFRYHQLSFPSCISRLDAALARFISRMKPGDLDKPRALILENNEAVMKEMESRSGDFPVFALMLSSR